MFTNYNDLKTSVANYLGRSDLTSQIPDFISLAELRLSREIRTRKVVSTDVLNTAIGNSSISLPSDFLEVKDMYVSGSPRTPVTYLSPSAFSREARADDSGIPINYTILGSDIVFAPVPDAVYDINVLYYFKPQPLSDSNPTNEFLVNYPDVLLYASLLEAEPYLMNDARMATWANMYQTSMNSINISEKNSEFSGVPLIMKVTK